MRLSGWFTPSISSGSHRAIRCRSVRWRSRPAAVAAATSEVNREVAAAAEARRIFVNAVDDPANGSAYTGGVLRRGGVTIAVSTDGRAPALAGLLREGLEAVVPDEIETWVRAAEWLKERQRAEGVPMGERRPRLLEALNELYRNRSSNKLERSGIHSREASGGLGGAERPPAQSADSFRANDEVSAS